MASFIEPRRRTLLAGGTIVAGHAVKFGADSKHVVECTATTDKVIGIAENGTSTLEDPVVVFSNGGGGKAIAQTTIALGKSVVSHTDGTLKPIAGANDKVVGVAMQDAVAGDMFEIDVAISQATATES